MTAALTSRWFSAIDQPSTGIAECISQRHSKRRERGFIPAKNAEAKIIHAGANDSALPRRK